MAIKFIHRVNRDGTLDSVCPECFATVATSEKESDLTQPEREHICDLRRVERYREISRNQ